MGNVDGRAIIAAWSENVLKTRFEDLDPATVDNAKSRIIDTIGCAIGGAGLPENAALAQLVQDWGGSEEATILAFGVKAPAHEAAMVNCILCRSFDWGPLAIEVDGRRYGTHTSETTVLTALALAEKQGVGGKELITALVVGDDIAARLFAASDRPGPGVGDDRPQALEPWGTVTTFGAAAIAGRLLGLDGPRLHHALGIALNMIAGVGSGLWHGATMFKLSQGTSARSGINAAELAGAGWTGLADPLFGEHGSFFAAFADGCDHPETLTNDLGKKYHVETTFKPYPGGGPTQAPTGEALALARKHAIGPEDVEEVTLRLSPPARSPHYMKPFRVGAYPTCDALFSFKYGVASALLRGHARNEDYDEEHVRDPRVLALIDKVTLADLNRSAGFELEVRLKDGRRLSEPSLQTVGDRDSPFPRNALNAKFMTQVEYSRMVGKARAERLLARLERLEEDEDVRSLVALAVR